MLSAACHKCDDDTLHLYSEHKQTERGWVGSKWKSCPLGGGKRWLCSKIIEIDEDAARWKTRNSTKKGKFETLNLKIHKSLFLRYRRMTNQAAPLPNQAAPIYRRQVS